MPNRPTLEYGGRGSSLMINHADRSRRWNGSVTFWAFVAFGLLYFAQKKGLVPDLIVPVEIAVCGFLVLAAIYYHVFNVKLVLKRLVAPVVVAAAFIVGSIIFGIYSKDWHWLEISWVFGVLLIIKGFFGPLSSATAITLMGYGLLHGGGARVPLIVQATDYILGETSVPAQYFYGIFTVIFSLANLKVADFLDQGT